MQAHFVSSLLIFSLAFALNILHWVCLVGTGKISHPCSSNTLFPSQSCKTWNTLKAIITRSVHNVDNLSYFLIDILRTLSQCIRTFNAIRIKSRYKATIPVSIRYHTKLYRKFYQKYTQCFN